MSKMLRVGKITYANCTPIFDGLEHMNLPYVEIVTGVPSELNQALANGEIDVCISSSIEYPRHADDYLILPDFCIGSDGPVESVLFFSQIPIEQLEGQEILVTSESATSVILLQILLKKHFGLENVSVRSTKLPFYEALSESKGVLVIGDTALKAYLNKPTHATCYDLGELWKKYTGLPFVYALWLVNKKSARVSSELLSQFVRALHLVHQQMEKDIVGIATRAIERSWIPSDRLVQYWSQAIQYRLLPPFVSGLERFYCDAATLGYIETKPKLQFIPE